MPDSIPNSWEPDPHQLGKNWRDMFRDPQRDGQPDDYSAPPPAAGDEMPDEDGGALDLTEYKPWIIQRVRSRPALMLEMRRYEARSGLWSSCSMSYPSLYALDCTGERLLSLDFGLRQITIEGRKLDELAHLIQLGLVLRMIEYNATLWPELHQTPIVTAIQIVGQKNSRG